jgi:hypothetical protein
MLDNDPEKEKEPGKDENIFIQREKRGAQRKPIRASFSMTIEGARVEGMGKDVSQTGAYFITGEDIPVEVTIKSDNGEQTVMGKIVRIDQIGTAAQGIAVQFDTRITDMRI